MTRSRDDRSTVPSEPISEAIEEEQVERTTIDTELLRKLTGLSDEPSSTDVARTPQAPLDEDLPEGRTQGDGSAEGSIHDSPTPRPSPSPGPASSSRSGEGPRGTLILPDDESALKRTSEPVSEGKSISELGPAFPEEASDSLPLAVSGVSELDSRPKPSDAPTAAKPGASNSARRVGKGSGNTPTPDRPEEDAWAGFEDATGWPVGSGASGASGVRKPASSRSDRGRGVARSDTNVLREAARSAPSDGARLLALEGEPVEFSLAQDELTVGRDAGNGVVVKSPSVSRRHAKLRRVATGYELEDLQSGNGTFVNGARVSRVMLKSGDEVRFGSVAFRFLESGEAFRAVDASSAPILPAERSTAWAGPRVPPRTAWLVAAAVLVSTALGLGLVSLGGGDAANQQLAAAFGYYLQGVEQFKQRNWASAEGFFGAALQVYPNHGRSKRYLDRIPDERRSEEYVKAAQSARQAGDLAQAFDRASKARGSIAYGEEADGIIRAIELEAAMRVERARAAVAAGDRASAERQLQGLSFFAGYDPEISLLRGDWDGRGSPPRRGAGPSDAGGSGAARSGDGPARAGAPGPHADAIALFADGRVRDAITKLDGPRADKEARALVGKMRKFEDAYRAGLEELAVKRADAAVRLLVQAVTLEEKLTGGRSKLGDEAHGKLADAYYLRGVSEFTQAKYGDAFKSFRSATQEQAAHQKSTGMLAKLEDKARDLFNEGYTVRDSDPARARELWRTVLTMVPAGHELARKAKARLDGLP